MAPPFRTDREPIEFELNVSGAICLNSEPNDNFEYVAPDAGIIRSTTGLPRQMQFGLRLSW